MKKFRLRGSVATGLLAVAAIGMFTAVPAHADDDQTVGVQTAPADTASDAGESALTHELETFSIKDATASHTYRFDTVTPSNGKLVPVEPAKGDDITSEVVVTDQNGKALGAYDAPWALDADNHRVSASYRIDGSTLVEVVNFTAETKFPVSFNRPLYSALTAGSTSPGDDDDDAIIAASSRKVTVPSNYVYSPRLGTLHDYCTSAPDTWGSADFRGPCARHDLCYGRPGDHKKSCDATLLAQLGQNCKYAYGTWNPLRYDCLSVSTVFYAAVTAFGDDH
ncbi:hypothetical protein ACIPSA_17065 [Streptomyces sp. NPDC086549]|uniref:hypothetical protein n=1 Tax=Streptomyces sp. NPDC086549 TaxID=3365752 RepID=UPI003821B4A0